MDSIAENYVVGGSDKSWDQVKAERGWEKYCVNCASSNSRPLNMIGFDGVLCGDCRDEYRWGQANIQKRFDSCSGEPLDFLI